MPVTTLGWATAFGAFQVAANSVAGNNPVSVTVGDFNGDGKADLATANEDSNNVSVLLGKGDGTFLNAVNYDVGIKPRSVAVSDFNGDGKADLATADFGGNMSVLLGLAPALATGPSFGSCLTQTFTFTFNAAGGFASLSVVDVLINNFLDGRNACYIAFVPSGASSGSLFLVNDAGDAGGNYAGMLLPGSSTIQNSQCSISGTGSSVSGSGSTLTLTLAITFKAPFSGNKVFYLAAQDTLVPAGTLWEPGTCRDQPRPARG